jgi:acyl-CoA reductase-like NAD-dependent aldehyde dehydrogenase
MLTVHEPLGVAALIAPWNFPIGMPARKVRSLTSHVGEKSPLTVHKPLGVAVLIAPWNFPIGMPARKVRFYHPLRTRRAC